MTLPGAAPFLLTPDSPRWRTAPGTKAATGWLVLGRDSHGSVYFNASVWSCGGRAEGVS